MLIVFAAAAIHALHEIARRRPPGISGFVLTPERRLLALLCAIGMFVVMTYNL
jgi:hypothetical protein